MDQKETREQFVRDAKSGLILDAARKVFAEKGFHEARLEEIAVQAGFSKAALYNYYSDKESIFLSLANRDFDRLLDVLKNNLTPQAKFIDLLEKNVLTVLSFFGEHVAIMLAADNFRSAEKANVEKLSEYHEKLFSQFKKKYAYIIDILNETIKSAKQTGEILCELDDQIISRYIISIVRGTLFDWRMHGKKGDVDKEAGNIVAFLGKGLNMQPRHAQ
jgi:AcrR family transcriptional regulator